MTILRHMLVVVIAMSSSFAFGYWQDCPYSEITASPEDGYSYCVIQCQAQMGPASLGSCTAPHMINFCENIQCAGAKDDSCSAKAGNPINFSNGAKEHTEVDYRGSGQNPLQIVRNYNSEALAKSSNFGTKWMGLAQTRVISDYNNFDGDTFTLIEESGARYVYSTPALYK